MVTMNDSSCETGVLYGIGVGPGDPELITLKAVRMIGKMDIIAAPGEDVKQTTAYNIAVQAVPVAVLAMASNGLARAFRAVI